MQLVAIVIVMFDKIILFHSISAFKGKLMSNPALLYIYMICKGVVC